MSSEPETAVSVTPITAAPATQMLQLAESVAAADMVTSEPVESVPRPAAISPARAAKALPGFDAASPPSTTAAALNPVARLAATIGRLVPHAQYGLSRIGPAGITGVVALVAAAVIALGSLIPGHGAIDTLSAKVAANASYPNAARATDEGFGRIVGSLPTRDQIPAVIGEVLHQAQGAGISLEAGQYAFSPPKSGEIGRYEFEFPVKASYPQVRDFINRTLVAVPSAGLAKLRIQRKAAGDASVSADVRFVVFVRE